MSVRSTNRTKAAMTMRDQFASHAFNGMLATAGTWWTMVNGQKQYASTFSEYARLAYIAADALINARRPK